MLFNLIHLLCCPPLTLLSLPPTKNEMLICWTIEIVVSISLDVGSIGGGRGVGLRNGTGEREYRNLGLGFRSSSYSGSSFRLHSVYHRQYRSTDMCA